MSGLFLPISLNVLNKETVRPSTGKRISGNLHAHLLSVLLVAHELLLFL